MDAVEILISDKEKFTSNFWEDASSHQAYLYYDSECFHLLINEPKEGQFCRHIENCVLLTITRGLSSQGLRLFQVDFFDDNNSFLGRIFIQAPELPPWSVQRDIEWADHLLHFEVKIWAHEEENVGSLLNETSAIVVRADSIPFEYALKALLDTSIRAHPYPWFDESMITSDEALDPEFEEHPITIYDKLSIYDFNSGQFRDIEVDLNDVQSEVFSASSEHQMNDGTFVSINYSIDEKGYSFLKITDRFKEASILAVGGLLWDKIHQEDYFITMTEYLIQEAPCKDYYGRSPDILNIEVVGRVPLIGVVYSEDLMRDLREELSDIVLMKSLKIIKHKCPWVLGHKT